MGSSYSPRLLPMSPSYPHILPYVLPVISPSSPRVLPVLNFLSVLAPFSPSPLWEVGLWGPHMFPILANYSPSVLPSSPMLSPYYCNDSHTCSPSSFCNHPIFPRVLPIFHRCSPNIMFILSRCSPHIILMVFKYSPLCSPFIPLIFSTCYQSIFPSYHNVIPLFSE